MLVKVYHHRTNKKRLEHLIWITQFRKDLLLFMKASQYVFQIQLYQAILKSSHTIQTLQLYNQQYFSGIEPKTVELFGSTLPLQKYAKYLLKSVNM